MPTYVYGCRVCGKEFEIEQRIAEDSLTDCDCGAKGGLRRLIQPVAVSFKGAGFHINDYASKPAPSEKSESSESQVSESTSPNSSPTESNSAESKPTETKTSEPAASPPPAPKTSE